MYPDCKTTLKQFFAWANPSKFTKLGELLHQNDSFKAENWLNYLQKTSFLLLHSLSDEVHLMWDEI